MKSLYFILFLLVCPLIMRAQLTTEATFDKKTKIITLTLKNNYDTRIAVFNSPINDRNPILLGFDSLGYKSSRSSFYLPIRPSDGILYPVVSPISIAGCYIMAPHSSMVCEYDYFVVSFNRRKYDPDIYKIYFELRIHVLVDFKTREYHRKTYNFEIE